MKRERDLRIKSGSINEQDKEMKRDREWGNPSAALLERVATRLFRGEVSIPAGLIQQRN